MSIPYLFATLCQHPDGEIAFKMLVINTRTSVVEPMVDADNKIKTQVNQLHFEDRRHFPIEFHSIDFPLHPNTLWWKMPLYYELATIKIPVIEFQYKAWLPESGVVITHPPLRDEITSIYESVNSEIFNQIASSQRPPRVLTPPIRPGTVQRVSTISRSMIQIRPLVLPQSVGQIILHSTRLSSDACPITSTPYSEIANLSVTSCFHVFDTESIEQWRETHSTCPVCRTEITNMVSE